MIIKAQFARLRQTEWWEYAMRFAFGGLVTVATGLIAKELGAVVGGLFLAFPGIFPAGVTLVERHERERSGRRASHRLLAGDRARDRLVARGLGARLVAAPARA